ncbi:Na+/H+ antiporter subunit E [Corynebacterium sanguinis]|uniref:Na+/H+ antiporter subunit E n=1 Tax=Corynebacterium sanguinis TaxID=2594913 RepID=A0A6C1TX77_9CORY|nr:MULTISPECIES: Na+/H+ antiporter subunit E [Corynebacterium]MBA4504283.1 Na+/H+ antiporter subunit E [Corynebacterium sanguinis]MCT1415022.1 Na+/H+ antiporter subunit E [Corynebacterium sanguinis]MCT1443941.1 Na+/H+ antiporter subunit E [Corynebacterium sanguinis]MCT1555529.1 Na+/H+ antiporter subunit E [Corynebacterium sanguinis]MCT1584866.1 Na+/H+ antiporter subunit E [Corynebacterium sanguinis]
MKDFLTWPFRILGFWAWYAKEFAVANVAVIKDVVTVGNDATPSIVRLECLSFTEGFYTLLASLITITPGTLVVGAGDNTSKGVRVMYVHALYYTDMDELRADLREMEERMLKGLMLRPKLNKEATL